ncbi:hypothetical protein K504DRAFT_365515, partial [Pleomassaria siparia CBS 279.74]
YVPLERDVRETRSIVASLGFPAELVLQVLDFARYWPEVTHEYADFNLLLDDEWSLESSAANIYLWAKLPQPVSRFENEQPNLREIESTNIVGHNQGRTTEDTKRHARSYMTSSWFEASIFRNEKPNDPLLYSTYRINDWTQREWENIELARLFYAKHRGCNMLSRPSSEMEPHRLHCEEMKKLQTEKFNEVDEGKHAWWLKGNQVGRGTSVFQGGIGEEISSTVVWGCSSNPTWEGNEGAGADEGFLGSLQEGDTIVVWSRVKKRGWENHVYGIRMTTWTASRIYLQRLSSKGFPLITLSVAAPCICGHPRSWQIPIVT